MRHLGNRAGIRCQLLSAVGVVVVLLGEQGVMPLALADEPWVIESPLPTTAHLQGIWGSASNNLFAVGQGGTIVHFDGTIWSLMNSGTTYRLMGVWGSGPNDVFAVGDSGTIRHFDGAAWSGITSGTTSNLRGVWGTAGDNVFVVGAAGVILRYDGSAWGPMSSGATSNLNAVWGSGSDNVFAAGDSGRVVRFDGTGWSAVSSGATATLYTVWGTAPNDVYVAGSSGQALHFDGESWTPLRSGSGEISCIWGSGPNNVYAATARGVWGYPGFGTWWIPVSSPSGRPRSLCGGEPNSVFVVGDNGLIARGPLPAIPVWSVPDPNASIPYPEGGYGVLICGSFDSGVEDAQQYLVREGYLSLTENLAMDPCNVFVLADDGTDSWTGGLFDAQLASAANLASVFQTIGQRMWDDANTPRNLYVIITGHGGPSGVLGCTFSLYGGTVTDTSFITNCLNKINLAGNGSSPIERLDALVTTCYGGGLINSLRSNFHALRGSAWPNASHLSIATASDAVELSELVFGVYLGQCIRTDGQDVPDLNGDGVLSIYEYYDHAAKIDPTNPQVPYTPYVPGTLHVTGEHYLALSEHPLYYEWNGHLLNLRTVNKVFGDVEVDPPSIEPNRLFYAAGTQITLRAVPDSGKGFVSWTIWGDPNHYGDANFAVEDTNTLLHLTMNRDYMVEARFNCGLGLAFPIVVILCALAIGVAFRRG